MRPNADVQQRLMLTGLCSQAETRQSQASAAMTGYAALCSCLRWYLTEWQLSARSSRLIQIFSHQYFAALATNELEVVMELVVIITDQ